MKKLCLSLSLVCVILPAALADPPTESIKDNLHITTKRTFQLPIYLKPHELPQVKEVQLYVSTDAGKNWRMVAAVPPKTKTFTFTAPKDGVYWFSVLTALHDGTTNPAGPNLSPPDLMVQVNSGNSDMHITKFSEFKIPVEINPAARPDIDEVRLYVSTDAGKHWKKIATVSPDVKAVTFTAPQDGVYWFSVMTVSKDGTTNPPSPKKLQPQLKVQVKDSKESGM